MTMAAAPSTTSASRMGSPIAAALGPGVMRRFYRIGGDLTPAIDTGAGRRRPRPDGRPGLLVVAQAIGAAAVAQSPGELAAAELPSQPVIPPLDVERPIRPDRALEPPHGVGLHTGYPVHDSDRVAKLRRAAPRIAGHRTRRRAIRAVDPAPPEAEVPAAVVIGCGAAALDCGVGTVLGCCAHAARRAVRAVEAQTAAMRFIVFPPLIFRRANTRSNRNVSASDLSPGLGLTHREAA